MTIETYDDLKQYVGSKDSFTDDLLNMGYTKGRADAIDDVIKKLAESEDTILTDKQYYTLMEMKEQKNEK